MSVWNTSEDGKGGVLRWKTRRDDDEKPAPDNNQLPESARSKLQRKVDDMLTDFTENTTLPGVGQFFRRRKIRWKLFWVFVSVSSTCMSLKQSWPILNDFIEGKTIQSTTYSADYDFPSVTVCSNVRLLDNLKFDFIPNYSEHMIDPDNITLLIDLLEFIHRRERDLNKSSIPRPFSPIHCTYNRRHCEITDGDDLHFFVTAFYGLCITFNIGTWNKKSGRPNSNLFLKFRMDMNDRHLIFNENYLYVWLHPPGTAPVLYRSEGLRVYIGDTLDIRFEMKQIVRLPKRGSDCVSYMDDPRRFSNIYYEGDTPYIYSTKACTYDLLFQTKKNDSGCLDPAVPKNVYWTNLWNTDIYNICNPGNNIEMVAYDGNSTEFSSLYNFDANCSLPCTEWLLTYTSTSTSGWFEAMVDDSIRASTVVPGRNKTKKKAPNMTSIFNYSEIKVGLGAAMVEIVTEAYRYSPGDFAGIIGGNIGFWIGLCVISLAEVVELAIRVMAEAWKRLVMGTKKETKIIFVKSSKT